MNSAKNLFKKILINNTPIVLDTLDANKGKYAFGQANEPVNVVFVLKDDITEIPSKLFSNTNMTSISLPEVIKHVAADAFEGLKFDSTTIEALESKLRENETLTGVTNTDYYTAEEAAAHNLRLPGALQYGAVKTPAEEEHWILNNQIYNEDPTRENTTSFDYICDENSWNTSNLSGGLKRYYAANPEEDLWYEKLVYSFTSYSNAEGTDEYATGKVEVTDLRNDGATVKVLENSVEGFVGQSFNVNSLDETGVLQLFSTNGLAQQIWVRVQKDNENSVSRKSEITDKRVDFESYADDQGTTKYGEGTVQVLEENPWTESKNYMKVKVLTNITDDPNDANAQSFINQEFYVVKNAQVDNTTLYQLYTSLTTVDGKLTPSSPMQVYVKLVRFYYPYCKRDWKGAYLNIGAKYPWIVPNFNADNYLTLKGKAKLIFKYTSKEDVMPWGNRLFGEGAKDNGGDRLWGCASVAKEFQDNNFLIEENKNNGNPDWIAREQNQVGSAFDINNFQMVLEYQDVEHVEAKEAVHYTNEEVDELNAELTGAVKEGDLKS